MTIQPQQLHITFRKGRICFDWIQRNSSCSCKERFIHSVSLNITWSLLTIPSPSWNSWMIPKPSQSPRAPPISAQRLGKFKSAYLYSVNSTVSSIKKVNRDFGNSQVSDLILNPVICNCESVCIWFKFVPTFVLKHGFKHGDLETCRLFPWGKSRTLLL